MMTAFKRVFARYRRDERGSIVVESALMFPTLFAACLATYVFFDAFRNQSINLKANYTISDMLSRRAGESGASDGFVTSTYLTSLWRMHRFLTNSDERTKLRVSVISYEEDDDKYFVCWSQQRGGAGVLSQSGLNALVGDNKIPVLPDGESLIVVQTWVTHEPIFSIGRNWSLEFEDFVVTAPRFGPQLVWSTNGTNGGRDDCND